MLNTTYQYIVILAMALRNIQAHLQEKEKKRYILFITRYYEAIGVLAAYKELNVFAAVKMRNTYIYPTS